jgi:hypothetical protein
MANIPSSFQKPPKTLQEQVQILMDRGVVVGDVSLACAELGRINYYRFCGYGLFFEQFSDDGKRLHGWRLPSAQLSSTRCLLPHEIHSGTSIPSG